MIYEGGQSYLTATKPGRDFKVASEGYQSVSKCRARLERKAIQRRDETFQTSHRQRFQTWSQRVQVLSVWADHFSELGESQCATNHNLDAYVSSTADLEAKSFLVPDSVLDCPIVSEEICHAISHLKAKSAGGADVPSQAQWTSLQRMAV